MVIFGIRSVAGDEQFDFPIWSVTHDGSRGDIFALVRALTSYIYGPHFMRHSFPINFRKATSMDIYQGRDV